MPINDDIYHRITELKNKIAEFAKKYKKKCDEIELVAVSKLQSTESIMQAYEAGIRNFGENYIQEWQKKSLALQHLKNIKWHLIGNVQLNKAKFINSSLHCLQSLSSIELAKEIEKKSKFEKTHPLNVLIQLQVDQKDTAKSGIAFQNADALCEYVTKSNTFNLCGFMGIGPTNTPPEPLKELYLQFAENAYGLWKNFCVDKKNQCILSLGMSEDLETAIACGSTMVRVGRAIFGERNQDVSK